MRPTPLCIYIIWHPLCEDGAHLARSIHSWFHGDASSIERLGLGIPVYYRTARTDTPDKPGLGIKSSESKFNIVIPLVEKNMLASPAWIRYLEACYEQLVPCHPLSFPAEVQPRHRGIIYPVALDSTAYGLPEPLGDLNFIRLDRRQDLPDVNAKSRRRRRAIFLRRQLTEACARRLLAQLSSTPSGKIEGDKVRVFLSHAKSDGRDIADQLRHRILEYGQLKSFFDETDLPLGFGFSQRLQRAAIDGTAMISIITDAYASRPWCRAELRRARIPRLETSDPQHSAPRWMLPPVLVVRAQSRRITPALQEVGNLPTIQWQPGREHYYLDLLMLELLLSSFQRLNAAELNLQDEGRHIINWQPDGPSLLALMKEIQRGEHPPLSTLVYPGHPLSPLEKQSLNIATGGNTTFKTFEEEWQNL